MTTKKSDYFLRSSKSMSRALSASLCSSSSVTKRLPMIAPAALACALSRVCLFEMPNPIIRGLLRCMALMRLKYSCLASSKLFCAPVIAADDTI